MSKPSAQVIVTPELIARFAAYHQQHAAWGSLHIVLDDHNLENGHVDFCIQYALENGDQEGHELGLILRSLSETQRMKISRRA